MCGRASSRAARRRPCPPVRPLPRGRPRGRPPLARPPWRREPRVCQVALTRAPSVPVEPSRAPSAAIVQRDDEVSAPVDMSRFCLCGGRVVRRHQRRPGRSHPHRRGSGARPPSELSRRSRSCWQEGLDEWRALRSFPELATIVREAFASGRSSLTPGPPDGRASVTPPPAGRTSVRPPSPAPAPVMAAPPRASPPRAPPAPAPRSNVVPITSRLATAEKLADARTP